MTSAQVTEATGGAAKQTALAHCMQFSYTAGGSSGTAEALVHDREGTVVAVTTPPGTRTDRGVGDGSTLDQVRSAYGKDRNIVVHTQAGESLAVTTGDPDKGGFRNPGDLIGFAVRNDNTVGPPMVGGVPGYEYCSG